MTDLLPWLGPVSSVTFCVIGLVVGWAVWAPQALRYPPPEPPLPPPYEPPPGLEYAQAGFRARYAERCRDLGVHATVLALGEVGVSPELAHGLAEHSPGADLAERAALDLAQAGWVEGARALAEAIRVSSPLSPALTERLLDVGHRAALSPNPSPPRGLQ